MSESWWQSWEPHLCFCYIQHPPPPHSLSPFLQRCDESLKRVANECRRCPKFRPRRPCLFFHCAEFLSSSFSGWEWARTCKYCDIKISTASFRVGSTLTRLQNKTRTFNRKLRKPESVSYASTQQSPLKTDTQTHMHFYLGDTFQVYSEFNRVVSLCPKLMETFKRKAGQRGEQLADVPQTASGELTSLQELKRIRTIVHTLWPFFFCITPTLLKSMFLFR